MKSALYYTVILDILFDIVYGISRGEGPLCFKGCQIPRDTHLWFLQKIRSGTIFPENSY